jgi:hypothetical protein
MNEGTALCDAPLDTVPVTTYTDYPMLTQFGERVDQLAATTPRRNGELLSTYYSRLFQHVTAMIQDDLVDPIAFAAKTSGSTGWNKWIVHGQRFWEHLTQDGIAAILFSCSDAWGETRARKGDKGLNVVAPVPYISGWGTLACNELFPTVPPVAVTDNEPNMRKKFYLAFQAIESGEQIALAGGVGSLLYMICRYFLQPAAFYQEYYDAMDWSLMKVGILLKRLQTRLTGQHIQDIRELMPLKGITLAGVDTQLYAPYFQEHFGLEVFGVYGATEFGEIMWGQPNRKGDLTPNLRSLYLEFLTPAGELKRVDEVKRDQVYSLIGTPFGSILFRYQIHDLVRVIDYRDDGLPIFRFEGRHDHVLDVYGYYRLTERLAAHALAQAGLRLSDKWAITKQLEPREHLMVLMEKPWPLSADDAGERIFHALRDIFPDFAKYVRDFQISTASDALRVEYLPPGAFLRYSMYQGRHGVPLGQYKPPKIIPPQKADLVEILRTA